MADSWAETLEERRSEASRLWIAVQGEKDAARKAELRVRYREIADAVSAMLARGPDRPDTEAAVREFLGGTWTLQAPERPGCYPIAHPEGDSFEGQFLDVFGPPDDPSRGLVVWRDGADVPAAEAWHGWWWSRPFPALLPPLPRTPRAWHERRGARVRDCGSCKGRGGDCAPCKGDGYVVMASAAGS